MTLNYDPALIVQSIVAILPLHCYL